MQLKKIMRRASAMSLFVLAYAAHAEQPETVYASFGVGLETSSGNYGTANTTSVLAMPLQAYFERGDWSWKVTVPFLRVTGSGGVITGRGVMSSGGAGGMGGMGGGMGSGSGATVRTAQTGLGDIVTMGTWRMLSDETGDSGLDLSGRVKFATAKDALGSGANDYAMQIAAYTRWGNFSPNLALGYEVLGSSDIVTLNNVAYGSLGSSYALGDKVHIGADYAYAQRASATGFAQKELSLYATTRVGKDSYLRGFVMKGLSDGSPDSGYGVSLSSGF